MASTAGATGPVSLASLAASRPGAAQSVVESYGGGGLVGGEGADEASEGRGGCCYVACGF